MAAAAQGDSGSVIEPGQIPAPEFPPGLSWLNTERPLTIRELRGKIVLLDFWTHCCINCMHALEDLSRLESKYADELVVIGVHSAKFDAERDTGSIRDAVLRLGVRHPVVNDADMRIWRSYGVRAWPTFMLVNPLGNVLGTHSGEGIFDLFDRVLAGLVRQYDAAGQIRRGPLPAPSAAEAVPPSVLSYPEKVLADPEGRRLFVADTGHHRIVVASLDTAEVVDVIGCGQPGLRDGDGDVARFRSPKGMAVTGDRLYVADTGNHAIRQVDLGLRTVQTLVGDGRQDTEWNSAPGGLEGRRLNSPWDLELAHGVLFAAMAGNHQIWGIDLQGGFMAGHAGCGREDHVDGPLLAASLAQPSGLTTDGQHLFVADSEVSSIRSASLDPRGGHVLTVVGKGLFDFGDVDGAGDEVRLQHPMGVVFAEGRLYVADSYNNRIKEITLSGRRARSIAGTGTGGCRDGGGDRAQFDEPSGLSYADGCLYVADTNNHAVRTVDLGTGEVSTLHLGRLGLLVPEARLERSWEPAAVRPGPVAVRIEVALPEGHVFSPSASSGVTLRAGDRTYPIALREGKGETAVDIRESVDIIVETVVYYCEDSRHGTCLYFRQAGLQPVEVDPSGSDCVALRIAPAAVPSGAPALG